MSILHHSIPGTDLVTMGPQELQSPDLSWPFSPAALVPSWEIDTPPGTHVVIYLRVGDREGWSPWIPVATWSLGGLRSSHQPAPDAWGTLQTDTFVPARKVTRARLAVMLQPGVHGSVPQVRALHLVGWKGEEAEQEEEVAPLSLEPSLPVPPLPVPPRSQMVWTGGGRAWCSPVSLQMVMAYWGQRLGRPDLILDIPGEVVPGVWDPAYGGHGNWSFNTAFAAAHGLRARVTALRSLADLEHWTSAQVPLICSVRYERAWLPNAPIDQTAGHLLVVTGLTAAGDVMVNEPAAARDAEVPLIYSGKGFARAWKRDGVGIVYCIHPEDWSTPAG